MPKQEGYEVVRFVERGKNSHIIMDYEKGQILIGWLRAHPIMDKEELFQYLVELMKQLDGLHHSQGSPCYRYLTPFSILMTQQRKVMLLNLHAKENETILKQLQRRSIRSGFFREGREMKPIESVEADIYSLGRTIQFILSHSTLEPPLSKREEFQFKSIIQKCLGENQKHSYHQIKEILKQFPNHKYQRCNSEHSNNFKRAVKKILITVVMIGMGIIIIPKLLVYAPFYPGRDDEKGVAMASTHISAQEQKPLEKEFKVEATLYMDLGLVYFLELKDYEKSQSYFAHIANEDELARCYQDMSIYMLGGSERSEEQLEEVLERGETLIPDEKEMRYYQSLLRVYSVLSIQTAKEHLIRLGEYCFSLPEWQEGEEGEKAAKELREYLAQGYEGTGQREKEMEQYQVLIEMEGTTQEIEKSYVKLAKLYQADGKINEAITCCVSGIEKVRDSVELRLLHLTLQYRDARVDRGICAETTQKYLQEYPEIMDDIEFQKLQQEYEIKVL